MMKALIMKEKIFQKASGNTSKLLICHVINKLMLF